MKINATVSVFNRVRKAADSWLACFYNKQIAGGHMCEGLSLGYFQNNFV